MSYNRYSEFIVNDLVQVLPFIKLPSKGSDKIEIYHIGVTRFDLLSYKYYGDGNYGWLIQLANPLLGSLEFNIPDQTNITIPYPLTTSLNDYKTQVESYIKYNGIN